MVLSEIRIRAKAIFSGVKRQNDSTALLQTPLPLHLHQRETETSRGNETSSRRSSLPGTPQKHQHYTHQLKIQISTNHCNSNRRLLLSHSFIINIVVLFSKCPSHCTGSKLLFLTFTYKNMRSIRMTSPEMNFLIKINSI